jgi:hypothetical protein
MSTLTLAYHEGKLKPDNNWFDIRPMLYPQLEGSWSCKQIDDLVEQL